MMDIKDAKNVIQNLQEKPFICVDNYMVLDNGYVIMHKETYDKLIRKKKGIERNLKEIETDLKQAKEEAQPIIKARNIAVEKIDRLENELIQYKLNNGLYRPMSDLQQYAGKTVKAIKLVVRDQKGNLVTKDMYKDEDFKVDDRGHLNYASFVHGYMHCDEEGIYYFLYNGHKTTYDFLGFLEIEVEE